LAIPTPRGTEAPSSFGLLLAAGLVFLQAAPLFAQTTDQEAFFEQRVKPVLESCAGCHTTTAMGGLRVDSRDALITGGGSGPAIVVGDPDKSLLIAAVKHTGSLKMPLGGSKLSDEQIAGLTAWIKNGAAWPAGRTGAKPESVLSDNFENHIRPVLAQQCFACHTSQKSAGLRLDSIKDMLAGGKSGPAVVPGDPGESLLMAALRHNGPVKMPKGGTRLTDEQLDHFTTWIKDGAYWPTEKATPTVYTADQKNLWSVQPLKKPAAPAVKDTAWAINDVDRFVLARLEKEGLTPAPVADRRTLLRRVTYDLIGLMPSHAEVTAFVQDTDANAWEKVIDRLLASPQYGERWARRWMDVVRYGEDDYRVGKQPDRAEKYPFAYLYRDWLIRAINDDMSYDMFIKAQLAADMLDPKVRDRHIPALGMNGNGIWIFHASPAPVERADEWHDKVDVTTKAFLGLTVGCARCHDHKYDAIPTKDYYQLTSVFASSRFKAYPRVPKAVVDEYEKQNKVLQKKNRALRTFLENASDLYAQMLFTQSEEYMVAAWKVETGKKATVESVADESKVDPELLGRWVKFLKKKPDNYSALVTWQEFVTSSKGKEVEALKKLEDQAKKLAKEFVAKVSDINEKYLKLTKENEFTLAQVKGTPVQDDDEEEEDPDKAKEPFDPLPNRLKRRLNAYQIDLKSLDREDLMLWRDVFETDVPEATADVEEGARRKPGLLKLTEGALERRLTADLKAHVERARADIEAFRKSMPPQYPMVYGIEDSKQPSDLKVFVRGNPYAFGEDAPRAFPSLLTGGTPKVFTQGSGRMELAEEIIRQPITARVIVNRIWRWHTGRGIVDTPSNFGMVGEKPTNPELLEHLATTFVEQGMSWKKLHKQILLSRTYQLSSSPVPANAAKDADNRFFWRANRTRLEAEGVWDALLQASDAIDVKGIGGPSEELSEKTVRRGVYSKVSRMYPTDFQATFDLPAATISAERRYTTNVPQQRLFFLNNSFVHKQADRLAERIKDAGDHTAQIKKAFEIVYQREATPEEIAAAMELLTMEPIKPSAPAGESGSDGKAAEEATGEAKSSAAAGEKGKDDSDAPKRLKDSPLRSFAWALLSSNEFLFID
jgi:mono/diheme cytochrome c family protein